MFARQVKTKLQALLGQREKKNPYCENCVTSIQNHTANIILRLRFFDYSHRVDFLMLSGHLN